jgi:hypothetical protein
LWHGRLVRRWHIKKDFYNKNGQSELLKVKIDGEADGVLAMVLGGLYDWVEKTRLEIPYLMDPGFFFCYTLWP